MGKSDKNKLGLGCGETIVICDRQDWVWKKTSHILKHLKKNHVRLDSTTSLRKNWRRLQNSEKIMILWENSGRNGGAVVEELYDVAPDIRSQDKLLVLTLGPSREDYVFFDELDLTRIVQLRDRQQDLQKAEQEIQFHLEQKHAANKVERAWQTILKKISYLHVKGPHMQKLEVMENAVHTMRFEIDRKPSPQYLDAAGSLAFFTENHEKAEEMWLKALELNPNYYRSCNHLIHLFKSTGKYEKALNLIRKMQSYNKNSVKRLAMLGEIFLEIDQEEKSEFYFKLALSRDHFQSAALNGLAKIRFAQGHLEECRELLSKSSLSESMAGELNNMGIELVRKEEFSDALSLYTKAQYVIPQQDKGPLLFYNIGLCYWKWGQEELATQFLRLALVKSPGYGKAKDLLSRILLSATSRVS